MPLISGKLVKILHGHSPQIAGNLVADLTFGLAEPLEFGLAQMTELSRLE